MGRDELWRLTKNFQKEVGRAGRAKNLHALNEGENPGGGHWGGRNSTETVRKKKPGVRKQV